ncbi:hypothetical protein [Flavihumibacter petaseus]|uniref:Outer membrane lipoprotein-sorting protein n=1 Tax=Flavihumibacter petaseus NBRC 106054 TaxID=1220578 RepID=A0A0E9MWW4_9BACT|nr:hypothetical protein [Flavihumibacter petaseus]GAO41610.1 hypothetical protein FPE01S_01_06240 [Flavihumibacter petaseus NBRC 106054]
MKKWALPGIITLLISCPAILPAQTVDEIISKYESAMGGREKLESLKSVYMEGVSVMQNGNELTTHITKVNKSLLRTETSFGAMGNFTMIATDKAGWFSNPRNGGKFEAMPEEVVRAMQPELDLSGQISNYAAKGNKAELVGRDTVNGKTCYKLKITLGSGADQFYSIDPDTWYIVKEVRKTSGMMGRRQQNPGGPNSDYVTAEYEDYQKTPEGYVFPHTIKRTGMGGNMMIEKIEVNQQVDPKLYQPAP